jgi:H+-transporting ATPase
MGNGLSSGEVRVRLLEYGHNEIPEKREHSWIRLAKKFWGLTPWMLEVTILLEFLLGKYFEMYIVAGLLLFARNDGLVGVEPTHNY